VYARRGFGPALGDAGKLALIRELGKASFLAQEAYFTAGAVRDIVSNLQLGQGLVLNMWEQLHSFNEQVADIHKDLAHYPAAGADKLEFAVDASKYMVRMASAALSANYNLVTRIFEAQFAQVAAEAERSAPPSSSSSSTGIVAKEKYSLGIQERLNHLLDMQEIFETWRTRGIKLMQIKDNPKAYQKPDGSWKDEATSILAEAPWTGEQAGFVSCLRDLVVAMNVEARIDPAPTMRLGLTGDIVAFPEVREKMLEAAR
jgi:hypothetical protein